MEINIIFNLVFLINAYNILTFLVVLVPYSNRVVAKGDSQLIKYICTHTGEFGRAHEATLVRVHVDTRAVHQQEMPESTKYHSSYIACIYMYTSNICIFVLLNHSTAMF